jgi:hypothetical protein
MKSLNPNSTLDTQIKTKLKIQIDLKKKRSKQSITVLTFYWSQFIKKVFTLVENYKEIENSNK